ncbi:HET-domain-containing protein [Lojkania enalia]|uniref:HET-domain-containing protein n=1 Tax=Lojkania enalia TaxID=147567 RepID=A0A9P4K485_9PLEO|nr:HET-domain-containing protein [Didymosphaeria enalia]
MWGETLLRDIRESAGNGCVKCSLTYWIASVMMKDDFRESDRTVSLQNIHSKVNTFEFAWSRPREYTSIKQRYRLILFSRDDTTYMLGSATIEPAPLLRGKTSSPASWAIAREWIATCSNEHKATCHPDSKSIQLPTRVLDLGLYQGSRADTRLFEAPAGEFAQYVCLSHCWGPNGCAWSTTSFNLNQHKECIQFDKLPRTFKDAIIFTRWLGIRFLWIDALCIIQNDEADWERESGAMASIFEHSYLTLSAVKAEDGADGLFMDINREASQYEFNRQRAGSKSICLGVRRVIPHLPINLDPKEFEYQVHTNFPLMARAWAFQERFLSPRVLHFGKKELYWECRDATYCECGSKDLSQEFGRLSYLDLLGSAKASRTLSFDSARYVRWNRLVERYSQLALTFPTDRLPAISSLAKKMSNVMPDSHYLAGIWQNDPAALIWIKIRSHQLPRQYVAPSWSWASVNKEIRYVDIGPNDRVFYTIVGSKSVPYGADTTGRVVSAQISVKGQVELTQHNLLQKKWTFLKDPDFQFPTWSSVHPHWDQPHLGEFTDPVHLALLRLAETKTLNVFLILEAVTVEVHHESETFRRVGLMEVRNIDKPDDQLFAKPNLFDRTKVITII